MTSDNFERCLAITLQWEGGYSNHPDDPGGPTMRGIIQREYDAWRKANGKSKRPVRQIEEAELQSIYREQYWDEMACDNLPSGMDLCVFDAAVNSGVGRARKWLKEKPDDIDAFCKARMAFLQRLGRLWRVFGPGWQRRVNGIRKSANEMANNNSTDDATIHAGMKGEEVRTLQTKLRALGYPCGTIDGVYGQQTYRAVVIFQHDHELKGQPGIWLPDYNGVLATASPMLPQRQNATVSALVSTGDPPIRQLNLMQRIFAWGFGASTVAQMADSQSLMDSISGFRTVVEPLQDILTWLSGNKWLLIAGLCVALIAFIRFMRAQHLQAFQNFDYQGSPSTQQPGASS